MPNIVMTKLKKQPKDKTVRLKIFDFLEKVGGDDSTCGRRVKRTNQAVAPRAHSPALLEHDLVALLGGCAIHNHEVTTEEHPGATV